MVTVFQLKITNESFQYFNIILRNALKERKITKVLRLVVAVVPVPLVEAEQYQIDEMNQKQM